MQETAGLSDEFPLEVYPRGPWPPQKKKAVAVMGGQKHSHGGSGGCFNRIFHRRLGGFSRPGNESVAGTGTRQGVWGEGGLAAVRCRGAGGKANRTTCEGPRVLQKVLVDGWKVAWGARGGDQEQDQLLGSYSSHLSKEGVDGRTDGRTGGRGLLVEYRLTW